MVVNNIPSNSGTENQPLHIQEDEELKFSNKGFAAQISSDVTDKDEFLAQSPFPSAKEMAILANAAYLNPSVPNYLEKLHLPDGWKFLTAARNDKVSNYYFGVAFWNPKSRQVVISHRGTVLRSMKKFYSVFLTTDIKGVKYNKYVPQIRSAMTFAEKIRQALKSKHHIHINFTGHSLGGWLAQITTFSLKYLRPQLTKTGKKYFLLDSKIVEDYHAHTVVFEAPGCKEMLAKMKVQLAPAKEECKAYKKRLDITIYLTLTNWINTTNTHLGTVLVFKENLFEKHRSSINPIRTHGITGIVNVFKRRSNHSEIIQEVHEFLDNKPYTTRDYDGTIHSLSRFSRDEMYFLISMESLQTSRENAVSQNKSEILDGLPKIALDGHHYRVKSNTKEELAEIVRVTKQGMLTLRHDFLQHINEHNFKLSYPNLQFIDNFGLRDFLNNKDDHLLQIVTDSKDSMMSAIHSILKFNSLYNSSDKHRTALYLSWENFNKLIKLMDLSTIINMSGLVVIESKPSVPFVQDIINYIQKNKMQKCILIDLSREKFSEIPTWKEIPSELLELKKNSQHELLKETLSQNRSHISAMDVFYQDINEEVCLHNVIKFLQTEGDTKFFITCSTEDEKGIQEFQEAVNNRITTVNNSNKEGSEQLRDFKKFCEQNFENRLIWIEIVAKNNVPDKAYICRCIYDCNLCIPRQLKSRWFINKDLFKKHLLKSQLKEPCIIIIEENTNHAEEIKQELNQVKNVRFVSSMEEATEISKRSDSPHHILTFTSSQQIEFERSVQSFINIESYINHCFITEDDFIKKTRKTVIIADEPGMGKTTTSTKLLHKLNNPATIHFDLKSCINDIRELGTDLNLEVVIQFLLKYTHHDGGNKLVTHLVKKALKENLKKSSESLVLTLLFDGFDEIPQEGQHELHTKLLNLLHFLAHETSARVWVITRRHYLLMLQDVLFVFDTTFQKISETEQKDYLQKHWRTVLKLQLNFYEKFESDLNSYTDDLYSTARQVLDASIGQFMGIPLQMRMLLEVARPKCVEGQIDKNVFEVKNVVSLYEAFINLKLQVYLKHKSCSFMSESQRNALEDVLLNELKNLALHKHFEDESETLLAKKEKVFKHLNECYRLGLIHQTGSFSKIKEFIHRTFQEYLCAQKLFELINYKCSRDYTIDLLLSTVLLKDDYKIIRLFLNHQFQMSTTGVDDETLAEHISKMWKQEKHELFDSNGNSCFKVLVEENHASLIDYLITVSGDYAVKMLSIPNKNNETPLAIAIREKHFPLVHTILDKFSLKSQNEIVEATILNTNDYEIQNYLLLNCELEICNKQYFTNMQNYLAIYFLKNVDNLLQIDNLLSKSDFFKNKALLIAAFHGYYETVKHLVTRMKYLDYSNCNGQTALHLAAQKGHFQIVQFLLENGANFQILDHNNKSFLHYATEYSECLDHFKYIEIIITCFKLKDIELRRNEALLKCIVSYCHKQSDKQKHFFKLLDLLIDCGVDINKTDKDKRTLLMYACKNVLIDIVQYLINNGAKVNVSDKNGKTALDHSLGNYELSEKAKKVFFDILNASGSNYTDSSTINTELLKSASQHCLKKVVQHLISRGVDVNAQDIHDQTALHSVIEQYISGAPTAEQIYNVVNILTQNDADIKDFSQEITILNYAKQHSLLDMIKYLITSADLNVLNKSNAIYFTLEYSKYNRRPKLSVIINVVKMLSESGANVNAANNRDVTLLMIASENCLPEVVEYLISNGANINATDEGGDTALHYAVRQASDKKEPQTILNVARILIQSGANVDAASKKSHTPLMLASENSLPKVVEYLISNGANVNTTNEDGRTALHYAADQTSDKKEPQTILNVARILIENGANVDAADYEGSTPLMIASQNDLPEVVEYLISNGANVNNITHHSGWTALHFAMVQISDQKEPETIVNVARILIENGANIDAASKTGYTPLMLASENGLPEAVEYLISTGANVNITTYESGWSALHYAVIRTLDKKEPQTILNVARILIENGVNIDTTRKNSSTPLMLASQNGLPEVVEYLISNGANVNNTTHKSGWTALHYAMMRTLHKKEPQTIDNVARILIENGANIDTASKNGSTPLMLASQNGFPEVVEYLISNGANINTTDEEGCTALHYAVIRTLDKKEPQTIVNVARILIEKGANTDTASKNGSTPLMLASQNGLPEVVEYLISNGANVSNTKHESG